MCEQDLTLPGAPHYLSATSTLGTSRACVTSKHHAPCADFPELSLDGSGYDGQVAPGEGPVADPKT